MDPFWLVSKQIASKCVSLSHTCTHGWTVQPSTLPGSSSFSQGWRQAFLCWNQFLCECLHTLQVTELLHCFHIISTLPFPLPTPLCYTAPGHIPQIVWNRCTMCLRARRYACVYQCGHAKDCFAYAYHVCGCMHVACNAPNMNKLHLRSKAKL